MREYTPFISLLLALSVFVLGLRFVGDAMPANNPKPDPLVFRSKGNLRVVRAVVRGELYLLVFEHKDGVWFFLGGKLAKTLPSS